MDLGINEFIKKDSVQPHVHVQVALVLRLTCFMPFVPTFFADIPLLNLRLLFVDLTPFGSLRPVTLNPTYLFRYFNWDFCF
jgi:hypothetical protein